MLNPKDGQVPLTEKIDMLIQDPVVVWSTIGACIAIALIASAISHLGSNTHGRPP